MSEQKYQLPNAVYTPRGLAEEAHVSPWLVRKEIQAGRLQAHRVGGKFLRILRDDAERWLSSQPAKPSAP